MRILQFIANSLAPLTLLSAVLAYLYPPLFLPFTDSFLWFFAATMLALGLVLEPCELGATLRRPKKIMLGLLTQYTVMPTLGFVAAYFGPLEPDLALGFIIVGCAPGAMASNVIVYLSGGAVAFSVALTTVATFLSPLLTPALVEIMGGVFVPIPFWPMVQTITLTVLVPLLLGMLLARRLPVERLQQARRLAPTVAVVAIVIIIGVAVAGNPEGVAALGSVVFLLVVLVNLLGYVAGWQLARLFKFDPSYRLALSIEVGMQNAGLGVALALRHFSAVTALPGVLFATWCILTATVASTYLKRKTERTGEEAGADAPRSGVNRL